MIDDRSNGVSEAERQAVIDSYPVATGEAEAKLDRLARLAANLCNAPVGLVSIVETHRQFFVGRSGTALTETPREQSFCAHAMLHSDGMVVPDATRDPRFSDNPLVTGAPGIRFYAGHPLVSREGVPLGSLCIIDTAPRSGLSATQLEVLATLADAATALLERGRLEQSSDRYLVRSRIEIAALEQRFQVLADAMPQLVWSTTPDGMSDYFNRGWCEFTGQPAEASYGQGWSRFLHDDDRAAAEHCWSTAVAGGQDYEIEYRLRHWDGEYRWVLTRGLPLFDESGEIVRWIGTCTDIQEQKAGAEQQEMLSRELSHRIKNIFAVIGGLISLTKRTRPETAGLAAELRDRVLALGRAHDIVRTGGGIGHAARPHAKLTSLLETLLSPYQDEAKSRIVVSGGDAAIDDRSATPLALLFHELATNAAKYGALSSGDGRVDISISAPDDIEVVWHEQGGPAVTDPGEQRGFGASLVEMSVKRQLGGTLDYQWHKSGLRVVARIPADSLAR